MSSLKGEVRAAAKTGRAIAALLLGVGLMTSAGCQVRPLHADAGLGAASATHAALTQIAIKPVSTRYGQEVRNHLIFLFNGGAGQPDAGMYTMNLVVTANNEAVARVRDGNDTELAPTAGTVALIGTYTVTENATGQVVANGTREITASYDNPRQEFAAMRAQRDAENRAARELAQLLQLAIASQMPQG